MSEMFDLANYPSVGRNFKRQSQVLLSDTGASGRMRLDAVARFLHDAATLDIEEVNKGPRMIWILRSTTLVIHRFPRYLEKVSVQTACSGYGKAWAERRTQVHVGNELLVDGSAIWVLVDGESGRPTSLGDTFFQIYGASAQDHKVSSRMRIHLPDRNPDTLASYPLRVTDLDIIGHVNNAVHSALIEQLLADAKVDLEPRSTLRCRIEFSDGLQYGDEVQARLWQDNDHHLISLSQGDALGSTFIMQRTP